MSDFIEAKNFLSTTYSGIKLSALLSVLAANLPGPPGPPGPPGASGHGNPVSQMAQNSVVGEQAHKGLNVPWFFIVTAYFGFPGEHIQKHSDHDKRDQSSCRRDTGICYRQE